MKHSCFGRHCVLGTLTALALGAPAAYAEVEYGLLAGASYSDNVERTRTDEQSSGAAVLGFDLRGARPVGRLTYDAYADVEYHDYFEDEVDSQTFGRVITQAIYAFAPEKFEWLFSGSFDQVREDLLRPIAPDNLEDVIALSTGPRLTMHFGDALEVQVQAHYALAEYSEREADSETVGGVLTLGRSLSERTYFGLGAAFDDVTYDVSPGLIAPDYERREYFVRFNTAGARTILEADIGYAEIEGVGIQDDGLLARARLTRQLTPFVSGFIGYTREFPTSTDAAFTPEAAQGDVAADASILTASPRETEDAQIGLELQRTRTNASLVYIRRSEAAVNALDDEREFDEVFASVNRLITTRSSVGLYGRYTKEEISDGSGAISGAAGRVDADETVFGANMMLAFGRALGIEARIEHRDRNSDSATGDYKELSGGIFIRYGSARRQDGSSALR